MKSYSDSNIRSRSVSISKSRVINNNIRSKSSRYNIRSRRGGGSVIITFFYGGLLIMVEVGVVILL